jgi:hypothetical protein
VFRARRFHVEHDIGRGIESDLVASIEPQLLVAMRQRQYLAGVGAGDSVR